MLLTTITLKTQHWLIPQSKCAPNLTIQSRTHSQCFLPSQATSNILSETNGFYCPTGNIDSCLYVLWGQRVYCGHSNSSTPLSLFRAHRPREEAGSFPRGSCSAAAITQWNTEVPHGSLKKVSQTLHEKNDQEAGGFRIGEILVIDIIFTERTLSVTILL